MKIKKIGHRGFKHSKAFSLSNAKDKEIEDNPDTGADSDDDFELNELCCELGLVEGQLCSIPYELFDLPDLREILSLDTWNSCLTEDERFSLSAYLPDMDQQTFCLTMREIFGGSDLYFGNPLDVFFKRLKDGFYPSKVAHLREALQFLQRKKYYHSLRSYHDRMTQTFIDMRKMWNQCEMSSGVEERILMWKNKRKLRSINLLDLNKFPKDDHLLNEEFSLQTKPMEPVERMTAKDVLPSHSASGMKCDPNCRAKASFKMKVSGNGLFSDHSPKIMGNNISKQCRSKPKGLLKILPKVPSVPLEQSQLVPRGAQSTFLVRDQGLQDLKFSLLPAYVHFPDASDLYDSPFLSRKVHSDRRHSTLNQPQCLLSRQECTIRTSHPSEITRKIERQIVPFLDDIPFSGKHDLLAGNIRRDSGEEFPHMNAMGARQLPLGGGSFCPKLHKGTEDFSLRYLESHPFGIPSRQQHMTLMKDKHATVYPRIPEAVPRTAAICNVKQEMFMASSSNPMIDETDAKKSEKVLSKSSISEGFKDETVLPCIQA